MIRVGVLGAAGQMGATVCRAVLEAPDLELVTAVDPMAAGRPLDEVASCRESGLVVVESRDALRAARADVAVDFTVAAAAVGNLEWCAANDLHAVCGTTGLDDDDLEHLRAVFAISSGNCVVAPNFSIGAALMIRCGELVARYAEAIEVIELHHEYKRDAPSGTSITTAKRLDAARRAAGAPPMAPDPTEHETLASPRGALGAGGIRIHSVRLAGLVAHQEVLFGFGGEVLSIRHDSFDRSSFMPGVLLALRSVAGRPGLTVGLDALLDATAPAGPGDRKHAPAHAPAHARSRPSPGDAPQYPEAPVIPDATATPAGPAGPDATAIPGVPAQDG